MKANRLVFAAILLIITLGVPYPSVANSGALDATFAGTGLDRFGFGNGVDSGSAIAVQSDSKIVLAGSSVVGGTNVFALLRLTTSNVLDASFGTGGYVFTPIGSQAGINALAIDATGNIIAAGNANLNSNYPDFVLARYLMSNGALDTNFGPSGTGMVHTDFGQGAVAKAMAIQADGKIVVVGSTTYNANAGQGEVALARYLTNGTLDTSFGTGGTQTTSVILGYTGGQTVFIQPSGTIVVAGIGIGSGHAGVDFGVYRYLTNGTLDSSFGSGGEVFTMISTNGNNFEYFDSANAIGYELGNGTLGDPDKLVVAGTYWNMNNNVTVLAMASYSTLNGSLDTTFGNSGITYTPIPGTSDAGPLLVDVQNATVHTPIKIVVGGSAYANGTNYYLMARYSASGALDTTFGPNGTGAGFIPCPASTSINAAAFQGNELVLAGTTGNAFSAARFTSGGSADTNFGNNGVLSVDIGNLDSAAQAVAVQPDGKIVVGGQGNDGASDVFAVARLNPDGSFDPGFGTNGEVLTPIGGSIIALAVQADGKIVATGQSALVRYLANGSLDASFGTGGQAAATSGTTTGLALQPDGKIVIAGTFNQQYIVTRYATNGSLDTSFGGSGSVMTSIGTADEANAVALQPDGKIVVSGASAVGTNVDFSLARFLTNGFLDSSFGSFGRVATGFGSGNPALSFSTAIQPDGRIILAGVAEIAVIQGGSVSQFFALARYNTNGSLDAAFGSSGEVITQVGVASAIANAVKLQPNGQIIATGQSQFGTNNQYAAVRYNQDGSLDNSFGTGGIIAFNFNDNGSDTATGLALDNQGRAILAGNANNLFGVARLTGNPYLNIALVGSKTAQVSWVGSSSGWVLQQNSNLTNGAWVNSGFAVTNSGGTNSFTAPTTGTNLYFRLITP